MVKDDIVPCVKYFEQYENLEYGCNSSFITLVTKIKDPLKLCDFRPINLIGCVYKIISKLLATRLKGVIGHNIGEVRSTFIEGRNILDGPLVIKEICTWAKKFKKKILLFQVDFDKAFDSRNWEYLVSILEKIGYGEK